VLASDYICGRFTIVNGKLAITTSTGLNQMVSGKSDDVMVRSRLTFRLHTYMYLLIRSQGAARKLCIEVEPGHNCKSVPLDH
jgi:hypothetical protein